MVKKYGSGGVIGSLLGYNDTEKNDKMQRARGDFRPKNQAGARTIDACVTTVPR